MVVDETQDSKAGQSKSRGKVSMNKGLQNTRIWETEGIWGPQGAEFKVIL